MANLLAKTCACHPTLYEHIQALFRNVLICCEQTKRLKADCYTQVANILMSYELRLNIRPRFHSGSKDQQQGRSYSCTASLSCDSSVLT